MGNALSMPNGLTPCPQGAQRCVAPKNDGAGPPESDQRNAPANSRASQAEVAEGLAVSQAEGAVPPGSCHRC
jgi:hypothetical protein